MLLEILNTDGQPLQDASFGAIDRGAESSVIAFDVWYRRGEVGGAPLEDLAFAILTEDPAQPGRGLARGAAPQDELWPRARVAGHDAAADPAQPPQVTDWTPLGAHRLLPLLPLHVGCARRLEVRIHPPSTATPGVSWRWYPVVFAGERSRALPGPPAAAGILHPVDDAGRSAILRGGEVTPSEPPDERLHVAMRQLAERGKLRGASAVELVFDLDAADRALAEGEHYWAVLTDGPAGVTVTKGDAGLEPPLPAPPVGEPLLRRVRVEHQSGGVPILELDDLDGEPDLGAYLARAEEGAALRIAPGQALGGGTWRFTTRSEVVPLPEDGTRHLWQLADGRFELTADETPPSDAALGPWWSATTTAGVVTDLVDRRRYASPATHLSLAGAVPAAPGEIARLVVPDDVQIERVVVALSDAGTGTGGATVLDVRVDDASIFPDPAALPRLSDDQRPRVAFDASGLVTDTPIPERSALRRGQVVTLYAVELPTSGDPPRSVSLQLLCR